MNASFPSIGSATPQERQLTNYLMEGIAHYVGQKPVDRRELIVAISEISKLIFTNQTPLNVKEQCEEIEAFCDWLKSHALKNVL